MQLLQKFLIVDDDPILNRLLTNYLRGMGHSAASLTDPEKVEGWLEVNSCEAVIVDITMPKLDGIALVTLLRKKYPQLPIVMFTGAGYDEDKMQAARKAGANGYVSKGLGPSEIYSALLRVLQKTPGNRPPTSGDN